MENDSDLRIVVHMLVRNEADVIEETLRNIVLWGLTEIVVLDGLSDDGTYEKIRDFDKADIELVSERDAGDTFTDHLRQRLLELTERHNPDWIVSLDADEIYHTDPVQAIMTAHREGATVVREFVPNFWITYADIRAGLVIEDPDIDVTQRRLWYSWGHGGTFIWKANPKHYYPPGIPKRTPEHLDIPDYRDWQILGSRRPIVGHYPFRSLEQSITRTAHRQKRGGGRYFGKYFHDWIIDERAAGLSKWNGYWERDNQAHNRVAEYMGRLTP